MENPVLVLSSRQTPCSQQLWRAAIELGWDVERIHGTNVSWLKEQYGDREYVLHVEGMFAFKVAQQLQVFISEPPETWLEHLPGTYRCRGVTSTTLGMARAIIDNRMFVKPPNDKTFKAGLYSGKELPQDYDPKMTVLIQEPVLWEFEFRCFILDRKVLTLSPYRHNSALSSSHFIALDEEYDMAREFAERVANAPYTNVPDAIVMDVGRIAGKSMAVIELNAAWASGIYECDPVKCLEVIRRACKPME